MRKMPTRIVSFLAICVACLSLAQCQRSSTSHGPVAIRLTELYKPLMVEGKVVAASSSVARTEWTFGKDSGSAKFDSAGVADLKIAGNRLSGRSTTDFPIVALDPNSPFTHDDLVHSVEIRMRASEGANLGISYERDEKLDLAKTRAQAAEFPWRATAPLLPGDEIRTYTLRVPRPVFASNIRHVLLRPTDAQNAIFDIESVRIIFRKEYLAGIPSGISWQGLSEIYHDTLVTRTPEAVRIPLTLPSRAWLDLSLGTLDHTPVTFQVKVQREGKADADLVLNRTISTGLRWESAPLDLSTFSNQKVHLLLQANGADPGTISLWGAPVVRSRTDRPAATNRLEAKAAPQGVILIWADTLRSDHIGVYGYHRETAPALRQMAAQGALFKNHFVHGTWTKVSTPSLMTSLYPSSHGIKEFSDRLPASATTLAEVFQGAGYATLNMSSILFTGQFTNLHQGFDEVHESTSLPDEESSKTARIYMDRLLPWLEEHKEAPFFVLLHVSDPHDPYKPYAPYDTLWANPAKAEEHERHGEEVRKFIKDPLLKAFGMPSREELIAAKIDPDQYRAMNVDWYDASIRAMDVEIGRLLERLRELKLDQKTLVLFVGDHGEEFFDHGRMFHGQSVYNELAHTPFIAWMPGTIPAQTVIEEPVGNIDVMPTILELSGLKGPKEMQGRSLASKFKAERGSPAGQAEAAGTHASAAGPIVLEKASVADVGSPAPRETESVAILRGGWKLIHNTKRAEASPEFELYDLRKDPQEKTNLANQNSEMVRKLTKELEAWKKRAQAARLKDDADAAKGMSQEELERLRSLGYIQ